MNLHWIVSPFGVRFPQPYFCEYLINAKTAIFQGHCKWVILHCGVSGSEQDPWKKRKKECQSKIFSYVWGRKCQNCRIGQPWLFHCLGFVHPFVTACLYKLIK